MEKIRLYDSYTREYRDFTPLQGDVVRMYACGPTVYNYAHIGNLRTYIFEDTLRRILEFRGYKVAHVVNITDVGHLTSDADTGEDKIEQGSRRTGKSAWDIAELYTEAFKADLDMLNILEPVTWCRATDHIEEQIADIQTMETNGFTYVTSDGVYFDTSKLEGYGYLARLDITGLDAGTRVDMGEKRHSTDFALWKFTPEGQERQMEWNSPWGKGFPGWHIECSAMAAKYLGTMFDIHCGGKDHIPVHHCNEIAQSEATHGTRLSNFWLHGYFLETEETKMSKSSGEFLRLQTLVDKGYDPLAYRYLCLTASYRSDLKFTWQSLDSASIALGRLRQAVYECGEPGIPDEDMLNRFREHVYNDLDTPKALALSWEVIRGALPSDVRKATLIDFDRVLGLDLCNWEPDIADVPEEVTKMVQARDTARKEKNWQVADLLRREITDLGYEIEDTPAGAKVRKSLKIQGLDD